MACNTQDADMLDKARMHPQVNYFDFEVKKVIKNISIFGFDETYTAPAPVETNMKSNLFATKPKKAPEAATPPPPPSKPAAPSFSNPPPPPPPAPKEPELDIPDFNQDFDDLHIEDEHASAAVEEVDPFSEAYSTEPPKAAPVVHEDEDEDDIDLS